VLATIVFGSLLLISVGLLAWQWLVARRFPLHQRTAAPDFAPDITVLKPLKGANEHTADCLRSWFTQKYGGRVQLLFGVADPVDPACEIVRQLMAQHPHTNAQLLITSESLGPNAKVSNLVQLARHAQHGVICVSDADVFVPEDFLANATAPLRDAGVGLVNCFYQLTNTDTWPNRWEAIAVNADFWSQVLQSNSIKAQDFALGAVMITRRELLQRVGGFKSLLEVLADDFHLGRKVAATGARIALATVVVECREATRTFEEAWRHQLRWARTVRVCQPVAYFFSVLNNVTIWAVLFATFGALGHFPSKSFVFNDAAPAWVQTMEPIPGSLWVASLAVLLRCLAVASLDLRFTRTRAVLGYWWLVPLKDLLQFTVWLEAFTGSKVTWAGRTFRVLREGRLRELH
jgi:ceramide glucosyltransferase